MTISSQPCLDVWNLELDTIAAEILSLSGLRRERLNGAAVELSIGVELHREECPRQQNISNDPYDEFLAFAANPGLDYTEVDGSDIGDLSPRQMFLAIAWHYVGVAAGSQAGKWGSGDGR